MTILTCPLGAAAAATTGSDSAAPLELSGFFLFLPQLSLAPLEFQRAERNNLPKKNAISFPLNSLSSPFTVHGLWARQLLIGDTTLLCGKSRNFFLFPRLTVRHNNTTFSPAVDLIPNKGGLENSADFFLLFNFHANTHTRLNPHSLCLNWLTKLLLNLWLCDD